MTGEKVLLAELLGCERLVWTALQRGDAAADAAALAPEFLGVYPDGFSGREAHVGQLAGGPTITSFRLSEARVLPLGKGQALLAYRADYRRAASIADEVMYVSSIWRRDGVGWRNIFSQDTPAAG